MAKRKHPQVITANRLSDGMVVYLAADRSWTEHFHEAHAVALDEDLDPWLDHGAREIAARHVVDVYPFDVALDGTVPQALSARERIRAAGPTVRLDLGKQAEDQA